MSYLLANLKTVRCCVLSKRLNDLKVTTKIFPTTCRRAFSIAKETVTFHDGRKGWIVEKKKGWFSINVIDMNSGLEKVMFPFLNTDESHNN